MVYMFLATGFEEVEALAPLDLLRRTNVEIKTVGVGGRTIVGAHSIPVVADMTDDEFSDDAPEMIILPGGMPGTLNLDESETVHRAIDAAVKCGAHIAAICAAPMILGKKGLLLGREAIAYPGFEEHLLGATVSNLSVVNDGRITTAKGMGVANEFGLTLVKLLKGEEIAEKLRKSTISE